ncbi:MAG: hypothetical protein VYE15_02495 [Myxococcota bacterium]|nr:hypothetical protein [Myxococcota bacterium]
MTLRIAHALALFCLMAMAGCATAPASTQESVTETTAEAPAVAVQYLQGEMVTTSPDGATPFGPPTPVIVKRVIDGAKGQILEDSWHGGEHHKSTMTLRAGTLIFDATNDKKTYEGTMTFATEDWLRGSVTYDIKMSDQSGTLTGTGAWEGDTYNTVKVFSDPTGTPQAKMTEALTIITEEAFNAAAPK